MKTDNDSKICEKIMDRYLMLDKHERIPLDVTLHLLKCRTCRTQVRYLSLAESYASEPIKVSVPLTDSKIDGILRAANPKWSTENFKLKPISMAKWIVCGILMLIFMLSFPIFAHRIDSKSFETAFYVLFGTMVTVYCALFIGSNLDFFIKKIEKPQLQ